MGLSDPTLYSSAHYVSQSELWADFPPGICLSGCRLLFLQLRLGFPLPGKRHGWASTKKVQRQGHWASIEPQLSLNLRLERFWSHLFQTLFWLPLVFMSETKKGMVSTFCHFCFLAQLLLDPWYCQRYNILDGFVRGSVLSSMQNYQVIKLRVCIDTS